MYFFQDDIGLLIQLKNIPFLQFLITPQAEHFAPVLHLLSGIEYRLFGLNFYWYVIAIIIIHIINCTVLYQIIRKITGSMFISLISISFFIINLTYTEPFLWFAANGVILSTLFLGLAFFSWYSYVNNNKLKDFFRSILFIILSGFSYGVGVAVGVIFAVSTFIYRGKVNKKLLNKILVIYIIIGLLSYFVGPLISGSQMEGRIPQILNPVKDLALYIAFMISGVSRGVVGRIFLPGFEPRHFEIIMTFISFLPFGIICSIILLILINGKKRKERLLLLILSIFITYPYIWAGFLRSHFGLKQALAERYAYPSIFFFSILIAIIIQRLLNERLIKSKKLLVIFATVIVTIQSIIYIRNANIFEEKPLKTKKYFNQLTILFKSSLEVLDLPLPSYINQQYRISQLANVITKDKLPEFIKPDKFFCTERLRQELEKSNVMDFYISQTEDSFIKKEINDKSIKDCLTLDKKRYNNDTFQINEEHELII